MKSGFVALLGRPNVGKSSLMNAFLKEKVSIVSPKPQTTRDKILGILSTDEYQMIFIDTPGLHKPKSMLGEYMAKASRVATDGVDAILVVIDVSKKILDSDFALIQDVLLKDAPVYVILNKVDLVGFDRVYPQIQKIVDFENSLNSNKKIKEIVAISCRNKKNIEELKTMLIKELPEGEYLYPPEDLTDKSERFMLTEIVREKALLYLREEIPHGIGVEILSYEDGKTLVKMEVDIIVEKDTHKPIVIGKHGDTLKIIGEKSRLDAERMLGKKVFLKLFVKVRENWRDKSNYLNDLGYNAKKNL